MKEADFEYLLSEQMVLRERFKLLDDTLAAKLKEVIGRIAAIEAEWSKNTGLWPHGGSPADFGKSVARAMDTMERALLNKIEVAESRIGGLRNQITDVEVYGGGGLKRVEALMERVAKIDKEIKSLKRRRKKSSKSGKYTLKLSEEKIKQAILGLNGEVTNRCWDLPNGVRVYVGLSSCSGFEASICKDGGRIMFCYSGDPDYLARQLYKYLKDTALVVEKAEVKV